MKIKRMLLWLLAAAALLLAGCEKKQEPESSYKVYYVNTTGTRLMESDYKPQAQTFEEMMDELIGQIKTAPTGYISALPETVSINGYERGIDALRIDFSGEYYSLSNTDEVLLRAAVVKTFSQIPGVTKVMITVNKEQLKDEEGEPVPAMDANSFIDTKEGGINSYQYATLILYFANAQGDRISKETRSLHYSSNMVLERVVVEQLIAGPQERELKPILGSNVRIQNVYIQDDICTINFDEEFNKIPLESTLDPEAALYAIVDSVCETCDSITGVKFEIDGESDVLFRDTVDLNQTFTMDRSFIEQDEIQTEVT
ncbi:MAG: GerMN domain-containing protein [Lachnospiraceae bacterium]|nr:GerMN domain-containing protein [Lachnospiraceae bacterium]